MAQIAPAIACSDCPIRLGAVCADCDADELARLSAIKSYRSYPAGATLARAGERLDHFSSILSGCASMSRSLEDGRRQNVGLLLPSDYIGRPGRAVAAFDVEAASDVTLCRFERAAFEALLGEVPHIASRLLSMTLDELDAARDWALVLGRMTARERVAAFLVGLARRLVRASRPGGAIRIVLPLSREGVADHLGLTLETTSRQITALRREGLIALLSPREIRIDDPDALARVAGQDAPDPARA